MTARGIDAVPAVAQPVCGAFLAGLQDTLGDNLVGVYLYGAMTFPDSQEGIGDIDFHVFLRRPLSGDEKSGILALRERLSGDYPPLGDELDGYYILVEDARTSAPPRHQMSPPSPVTHDAAWALHCAHVRAGKCIVLLGPDPTDLYPEPTPGEIDMALSHELDFVRAHLDDAPAYCVLNLCRLLYSVKTGNVVVSKRAAADWARQELPEWAFLIDIALRVYAGTATAEDAGELQTGVQPFYEKVGALLPW